MPPRRLENSREVRTQKRKHFKISATMIQRRVENLREAGEKGVEIKQKPNDAPTMPQRRLENFRETGEKGVEIQK